MRFQGSRRFAAGVASGAGATALVGSLVFLAPSGATEGGSEASGHDGAKVLTEAAPAGLADGAQEVVTAGSAGGFTVQRVGTTLTIVGVSPAAGWAHEVLLNDAETVKVAFTGADTLVLAAATLAGDATVDVAVIDKALPPPPAPAPAVAEAPVEKAQKAETRSAAKAAGVEHGDDWCDEDGDGRDDRFEGAAFDGDRDDDDHDGDDRWDDHDGDRDHDDDHDDDGDGGKGRH